MSEKLLTEPAQVHHTIFPAGLPERMVIECAQRHYKMRREHPPLSVEQVAEIGRVIADARRSHQTPVPPYVHPAPKRKPWWQLFDPSDQKFPLQGPPKKDKP